MLKTRLITGVLLIGMIFWSIFSLPAQAFGIIVGILSLCMMREWITIIGIRHRFARILILDLFLLGEFLFSWFLPEILWVFLAASLFWIMMIPVLIAVQCRQQYPRINQSIWLMVGYFTLWMFFAGLLQLRHAPQGDVLVLMVFIIVWCSDSFAYAVGKLIGKHKMIPFVSPGKTWEGFIGTCAITLPCLAAYWVWVLHKPIPDVAWYVAIGWLVIMSVAGDLFESLIKRIYQVKDSSQLLPGHGGLLDRFDSLMAVAPVFAALTVQGLL